jgi:hypothetical protein
MVGNAIDNKLDIKQKRLIPLIQAYLNDRDIDLKVNESGICAGLSNVASQYMLEGRSAEFQQLMSRIASKIEAKDSSPDSEIDEFIQKVIYAFMPQEFDHTKSQPDMIQEINADGEKVALPFQFSAVTSDDEWSLLFSKIYENAQGSVIRINSPDHAITVHCQEKGFVIYDPNQPKFRNVRPDAVVDKLKLLLTKNKGAEYLPMSLAMVAKPSDMNSININAIEDVSSSIDHKTTFFGKNDEAKGIIAPQYDSLILACLDKNTHTLEQLLSNGVWNNNAIYLAAKTKYNDGLALLLETAQNHQLDDATIVNAILNAASEGNIDGLNLLCQYEDINSKFMGLLELNEFKSQLLGAALYSSNNQAINYVIDLLAVPKNELKDLLNERQDFSFLTEGNEGKLSNSPINIALEKGNTKNLSTLFSIVDFSNDEINSMFMHALEKNNYTSVKYLIDTQKSALANISLNFNQTKDVRPAILELLSSSNISFTADAVEKKNQILNDFKHNLSSKEQSPQEISQTKSSSFKLSLKSFCTFLSNFFKKELKISEPKAQLAEIKKAVRQEKDSNKTHDFRSSIMQQKAQNDELANTKNNSNLGA